MRTLDEVREAYADRAELRGELEAIRANATAVAKWPGRSVWRGKSEGHGGIQIYRDDRIKVMLDTHFPNLWVEVRGELVLDWPGGTPFPEEYHVGLWVGYLAKLAPEAKNAALAAAERARFAPIDDAAVFDGVDRLAVSDGVICGAGVLEILRERREQLVKHGYTREHDEGHATRELLQAAGHFLGAVHASLSRQADAAAVPRVLWPWPDEPTGVWEFESRMNTPDRRVQRAERVAHLARCGAMVAAAIDAELGDETAGTAAPLMVVEPE